MDAADNCWTNGVAIFGWKENGCSSRIGAGVRLMVAGALSCGHAVRQRERDVALLVGQAALLQQFVEPKRLSVPPIARSRGVSRNWLSEVAGWRCSTTLSAQMMRR